ncbi:helix-turn-helix domain-containing protein [Microcoleus sp. ZQ-A2]|nr:helix-turn-helix domain-containing protein [Microcoleus sp. FACHB-1]
MSNPRPLGERELRLIEQFTNCQLKMTPRQFYSKWDVTYATMAQLCRCDVMTVSRWFRQGCNYRPPKPYHKWYLALADLVLESYEDIPEKLLNRLCPRRKNDDS